MDAGPSVGHNQRVADLARPLADGARALITGPAPDLGRLAEIADQLADRLDGAAAALASSCARFLRHLEAGDILEPDALLVFASSTEALTDLRVGDTALQGARFELESFFPVPGAPGPTSPDVPLDNLRRR